MKYIKLNKIYKMNNSTVLINFNYNCEENSVCFNSSNICKIKKCLRKGTIKDALKYWKSKYNLDKSGKKREISINSLNSILNSYGIEYNFIGKYLLNLKLENSNYIIDFISDSIQVCNFIESFDNSKQSLITEVEDKSSDEESENLISKIEKINQSIPNDLQSLIKFSIENTDVIRPVIKLLNSKTDNMFGDIIEKAGFNLDVQNKVNSDDELLKISKYLKLIEELNNTDISNLSNNEFEKFNFIISEIWNQVKKIINTLNNLSASENYDSMLHKYKDLLTNVSYTNEKNKNILEEIIHNLLNETTTKILHSYFQYMESKYLELNIILQNISQLQKGNQLIDSKIEKIMENNSYLFNKYFTNIFNKDELYNIFSDYNKQIRFQQVLNNLNAESKNYLILKINNFDKVTSHNNTSNIQLNIDNLDGLPINSFKFNNNTEDIIDGYYKKYTHIINMSIPNKEEFNKNINSAYNQTIFLSKKKDLSSLLVKFHEEIKFKLSIISKIIN